MRWPWQRDRRPAGESTPTGGVAGRAEPPVSPMGYAFLPPIQRTLATPLETVSHPLTFPHQLPAWRDPSFSEPRMTHLVSRDAPSGVIAADDHLGGVPQPGTGRHAELTLLPPPAPKQVQRAARTPLTSVAEAAPSLPVVHRRTVPEGPPPLLPDQDADPGEPDPEPLVESPEPPAEPDGPVPPQAEPPDRVRQVASRTGGALQRAVSPFPTPAPAPAASPARRPRMTLGGPLAQVPATAAESAAGRTLGSVQRHRSDTAVPRVPAKEPTSPAKPRAAASPPATAPPEQTAPVPDLPEDGTAPEASAAPTATAPLVAETHPADPVTDAPSTVQRSAAAPAPMPLVSQPAGGDAASGRATALDVAGTVPPAQAGQGGRSAPDPTGSVASVPRGQADRPEPTAPAPATVQRSAESPGPTPPSGEHALLSERATPPAPVAPDAGTSATPAGAAPLASAPAASILPDDAAGTVASDTPGIPSSGPGGPGPAPSTSILAAEGGGATLLRATVARGDRPTRAGGPGAGRSGPLSLQRAPDVLDPAEAPGGVGHSARSAHPAGRADVAQRSTTSTPAGDPPPGRTTRHPSIRDDGAASAHDSRTSVVLLDPAPSVAPPGPGEAARPLVLPGIQRAGDRTATTREAGLVGALPAATGLLQIDRTAHAAAPGPANGTTGQAGPVSSMVTVQRSPAGAVVAREPDAPTALAAAQQTARLAVQRSLQRTVTQAAPEAVQRSVAIDEVDTTLGSEPSGTPSQGDAPGAQTFSAQAPPPNAGAEELSAKEVEELADQLVEPLLRRIRQQLLRDRERLGRRQDRWW